MAPVSLALVWHQHQPYYPDDVGGENPMPWVRLHATKDYLGMALHLEEVPEFRCTINLVPSLLAQLEAYVDGATDTPPAALATAGRRPGPRRRLLRPRQLLHGLPGHDDPAASALPRAVPACGRRGTVRPSRPLRRFRPRDLRDLQVWSNLAWIHPLSSRRTPSWPSSRPRGGTTPRRRSSGSWTSSATLLAQVIPLHRELAERGQVELTTTPYYHPILPLLLDKTLAREAMPDVTLPAYRGGYPEDAAVHVRRAVESHAARFGERPRGMWPSEGSVCQAMIPLLAEHGIEWIATDEEILGCSTHGKVGRDSRGHVRHPELLYRPWKVREAGHELAIVFRDHSMSDQVGFHYQRSPGPVAAGRLPRQAARHRRRLPARTRRRSSR